ncbi:hypothetical protein EV356DRAFT_511708 [Viridothelium virens]|uniref:Uncharacterized protein n=1 Tax=Viridothelium virens TaxID=1048519 RepID=A0A6A6GTN7_VIRVR|nr:hypothetical protein EV356DRAFT_511708 [Viridothelium virens]
MTQAHIQQFGFVGSLRLLQTLLVKHALQVSHRRMQRFNSVSEKNLPSATSGVGRSLILQFPLPEKSLRVLRSLRAKLTPLSVVPTVRILLKELDEDIRDLEKLIQSNNLKQNHTRDRAKSPVFSPVRLHDITTSSSRSSGARSVHARARQTRGRSEEEQAVHDMSGALPEGAQAPLQDDSQLVRDIAPIEQTQGLGSRGHLIAAAHQKDERLRLGQIWRCGPRAFINDIFRREISRRLQDGEEIRLLDKETVAFLEEKLKNTALQDGESRVEDRGRRRHRDDISQSREMRRARRRGNDSTGSESAMGLSAPSTSMALIERPIPVEFASHSQASGSNTHDQSDIRSHDTEGMLVRYGDEPVESRDIRYGSRTYQNIDADEGRPLRSATVMRRGDRSSLAPAERSTDGWSKVDSCIH